MNVLSEVSSIVTNEDCMDLMSRYPDKYFDLAIVDPPYGIDVDNRTDQGKKRSNKSASHSKEYENKGWDKSIPNDEYFNELFRVSKNQIIWGANFFGLMGGYIYWNKDTSDGFSNGDGELAYCSGIKSVREVKIRWNGMLQYDMRNKENRIHPTQKPIPLYKWCLQNYAKEGDKILDTHLGSQSSRIASHEMGFDFVGCELDPDYFKDGCKRFEDYKKQLKLF
jgi:site-specific DNA-methyltransferase (adenine-specific)